MYDEVATVGWLDQLMETILQKSPIYIGFCRSFAFECFLHLKAFAGVDFCDRALSDRVCTYICYPRLALARKRDI